jgi:hypothetical protein
MTNSTDTDTKRPHAGAQPALPFSEEELASNGPRLRPAELARLLGVSRQSVHAWIGAGKVRLGADGRIDPRKAVADVLKASDPARLRARVLAPFAEEIAALRGRVAHLVHELAQCEEDREFHEGAAGELAQQVNRIERLVRTLPGIEAEARAALLGVLNPHELQAGGPMAGEGAGMVARQGEGDAAAGVAVLAGLRDAFQPGDLAAAEAWLAATPSPAGRPAEPTA